MSCDLLIWEMAGHFYCFIDSLMKCFFLSDVERKPHSPDNEGRNKSKDEFYHPQFQLNKILIFNI